MVGKKSTLNRLISLLKRHCGIQTILSTRFTQGKTMRWGLVWSFYKVDVTALGGHMQSHLDSHSNINSISLNTHARNLNICNNINSNRRELFSFSLSCDDLTKTMLINESKILNTILNRDQLKHNHNVESKKRPSRDITADNSRENYSYSRFDPNEETVSLLQHDILHQLLLQRIESSLDESVDIQSKKYQVDMKYTIEVAHDTDLDLHYDVIVNIIERDQNGVINSVDTTADTHRYCISINAQVKCKSSQHQLDNHETISSETNNKVAKEYLTANLDAMMITIVVSSERGHLVNTAVNSDIEVTLNRIIDNMKCDIIRQNRR